MSDSGPDHALDRFSTSVPRRKPLSTTTNGMDAPTCIDIKCAKVEALINHLNREGRPP